MDEWLLNIRKKHLFITDLLDYMFILLPVCYANIITLSATLQHQSKKRHFLDDSYWKIKCIFPRVVTYYFDWYCIQLDKITFHLLILFIQ